MKYIRRLSLFENSQDLDQEQIDFLNDCALSRWEVNKNTGLVDVEGDFDATFIGIESLKGIRFGRINGNFFIGRNKLTSLEGSPQEVSEGFYCHCNKISSLEGAPEKVGTTFQCGENSITSLEGAPQGVGENFDCSYNKLKSLEGAPQEVGDSFHCQHNSLTSLEGAPQEVGGSFDCQHNSLTSLEGAPQEVGGSFDCSENKLKSLEGSPEEVGGSFFCKHNSLTSLEGSPKKIGRNFQFDNCNLKRWNLEQWMFILMTGDKRSSKLISTNPQFVKELEKEIKKNPGKWAMELKGVWNSEEFRPLRDQLRVSDQFLKDIGAQSTLSDLGF